MGIKITNEEVIRRNLNSKFSSSTDFSLFKFINTHTKSRYFCNVHRLPFDMTPSNFWNGHGCSKCGLERSANGPNKPYQMKIRKSNIQIISEFEDVHGKGKYDYSKVDYQKNNIKVEIICKKVNHGSFYQTPNKHLLGRGCPLCANETRNDNKRRTLKQFIEESNKIHDFYYDYSDSIYTGALSYINIRCPKHGIFKQKANDHLNGHGCKYCGIEENAQKLLKSTDDIIQRAKEVHGDFFDYSKVQYKGIYERITIICPIHKEFNQIANVHLRGGGCPKCSKSKGEKLISKILDKHKISYKEQHKFQECRYIIPLPFDFYLYELSICIEFQGEQHYFEKEFWGGRKSFEYLKNNDSIKKEFCRNNKIGLIEVPYMLGNDSVEEFIIAEIANLKL
jgi:hypothetical protein